ncbi:type I-E CRISPR-associated protein Cas6/Cse3/CasE [Gemmatimonadota bacterium]
MYISEFEMDGQVLMNPYNIHRQLWNLFPGRRDESRKFLYRVEWPRGVRPAQVLMLSEHEPNQAETGKNCLLLRKKKVEPYFSKGQLLRFSLCANPVKRLSKERCRVPLLYFTQQLQWLERKLASAAEVIETRAVSGKVLHFRKGSIRGKIVTVIFTGILQVKEPDCLLNLMKSGIGPAKSFGCGLLSLARVA